MLPHRLDLFEDGTDQSQVNPHQNLVVTLFHLVTLFSGCYQCLYLEELSAR